MRAEWAAWRKAADGFLDALDEESEAVDRRRKRATMQKRRADEAEAKVDSLPTSGPRNLLAIARAQGLPV
jgi:hypothetical protein